MIEIRIAKNKHRKTTCILIYFYLFIFHGTYIYRCFSVKMKLWKECFFFSQKQD